MKKTVKVVAAIIENENKEILCALRSPNMALPNMWEFPGGKVEKGEDLSTALKRESNEELRCHIETMNVFNDHTHEYDTVTINLISIKATIISGVPVPNSTPK